MKYEVIIMIKHNILTVSICVFMIFLFCNCRSSAQTKPGIQEGVRKMAEAIVRDLHNEGPIAWLKYFTKSKQFFMASNGMLVFPNIDSANKFVPIFAKQIKRVELKWKDIRIDSLSPKLGIMGASYHEDLIGEKGVQDSPSGYFTGLVENTSSGWKLRDAHWSTGGPQH
jgi:hypothetical protein